MKLKKQLEKQRVLEKKEVGDFCEQFDFRSTTKLSARKPHKKHKKPYRGEENDHHPKKLIGLYKENISF